MQSTMMRSAANAVLTFGAANVAGAHTLSADETVAQQLHHQAFALHHLPMTVVLTTLLLAVGVLLARQAARKSHFRRPRGHRNPNTDA